MGADAAQGVSQLGAQDQPVDVAEPAGGAFSSAGTDVSGGRRTRALTMSMAVLPVMTRSQFTSVPPEGSNDAQARQARRKASWTTSSARSGSTTTRRARASRRA